MQITLLNKRRIFLRSRHRWAGCVVLCVGIRVSTAQQVNRAEALGLEAKGQVQAAEQVWQAALKANPSDGEALARLGVLEARQEHYAQAIGFYCRALAIAPETPGLRLNLGLAYFKNAQFAQALEPFTTEYRKHPDDPRLTLLLGMSHYGMGDYLVAIPYLQRGAQQQPANLPLRLALAHSCLWSRQFECVKTSYREILTLNPSSAEAEMLIGEALDETGDDAGAMEHFHAAVAANSKEPNVHFGLGYLLWSRKAFEDAAHEFTEELANDPQQVQAQVYLADSYMELNRFREAEAHLRAVLEHDPGSELAHRDLGIIEANTGDLPLAEAELRRAIALDATDTTAHFRLARVLKALGKEEEATAEFKLVSEMKEHRNDDLIRTMQADHSAAGQTPKR